MPVRTQPLRHYPHNAIKIAVDFDGTVVTHDYPRVGKDIGAAPVLKELVSNGCEIILFTMRDGQQLQDAVDWFAQHDIPLAGVNHDPEQDSWTTSPKAFAHLYIDDSNLGCPIVYDKWMSSRPFVDWGTIRQLLIQGGLIK